MRHDLCTGVLLSLFLFSLTPTLAHAQEPSLGDQLRKGGYVIFFRHGKTEDTKDSDPIVFNDCSTQRNLNDQGRDDLKKIGAAIRAARIPVGNVRSSEFCRCIESAQLAFGRADREPVLTSYLLKPESERPQAIVTLKQLLSQLPESGTNTILVGHHNMFRDAAKIILEEGEGVVLEPHGDGTFRVVAQVKPEYWAKML